MVLNREQQQQNFLEGALYSNKINKKALKIARELGCEQSYLKIVQGNKESVDKVFKSRLTMDGLMASFLSIFQKVSYEEQESIGGILNEFDQERAADLAFEQFKTENPDANMGLKKIFFKKLFGK